MPFYHYSRIPLEVLRSSNVLISFELLCCGKVHAPVIAFLLFFLLAASFPFPLCLSRKFFLLILTWSRFFLVLQPSFIRTWTSGGHFPSLRASLYFYTWVHNYSGDGDPEITLSPESCVYGGRISNTIRKLPCDSEISNQESEYIPPSSSLSYLSLAIQEMYKD